MSEGAIETTPNPYGEETPGAVNGATVYDLSAARNSGKTETATERRERERRERAVLKAAERKRVADEAQTRREEIQARSKELSDLHDDIPDGYETPAGWICDSKGILKIVERRDGDLVEVRVAYGPIIPVATHTDPDGAQLVELLWNDGHRWVNRLVPRSIAKSGKKLIAAVGDAGFPATEASGRDVEQWLAAAEAYNRGVIREHRIARWLGWQPDGTFISSPDETRIEVAFSEQQSAVNAHRPSGTLTDWQNGVAVIEKLPVAKMALFAGLAAPLLDIVRVDSFVVDFSGRSTRGKTTAAKIGLSCWADPSEKGDGTFSWRTTTFAIEKRLNLVRGLPVLLDETRVVTKPEMIDEVLYQVSKNHGKARSAPYPSLLPWSTVVISTGEQPALSFTTHQGASARILGLTRPPFGSGTAEHAEAAVTVGRAVDENYGHAGPAFVARLRELLAEDGGRDKLIARHRVLTDELKGTTDLAARRAPLVAALALAAELSHEWRIAPALTVPETAEWQALFTSQETTDDRAEMALDAVREWVASNGAALWYPNCTRHDPPGGWIGRTIEVDVEGKKETTVALMPLRLKAAMEKVDIVLDTVLPSWKENGWLVPGGDKARPWDPKRRLAAHSPRLYTFHPSVMGGDYESDPTPDLRGGYVPYGDAK